MKTRSTPTFSFISLMIGADALATGHYAKVENENNMFTFWNSLWNISKN